MVKLQGATILHVQMKILLVSISNVVTMTVLLKTLIVNNSLLDVEQMGKVALILL